MWKNLLEDIETEFGNLACCLDVYDLDEGHRYTLVNSKAAKWTKSTRSCTTPGGKSYKDRYHADLTNYRAKGQARHKRWCEREKAKRLASPRSDKRTWKLSKEDCLWAATCGLPAREVAAKLGVARQYVHRLRADFRSLTRQNLDGPSGSGGQDATAGADGQ